VDFIFMLTRDDQTVPDCLELIDEIADLGPTHIGFKDVGVDPDTLGRLHRRIRNHGATSYLEVVSTSRDRALESARIAVRLGVDWLMGGTWVTDIIGVLAGSGVRYLPFPGTPIGHPTRLGGTPQQVADDCRRFEAAGCAGVDLLAYRATEATPVELIRSARAATAGRLVVAGSITTVGQIRELTAAGVDAFTVGSAALNRSFVPSGTLHDQLSAIMAAVAGSAPTTSAPNLAEVESQVNDMLELEREASERGEHPDPHNGEAPEPLPEWTGEPGTREEGAWMS
jgi:hypothetical protein